MAGVIPAIFASSLVLFPATISTWFGQAGQSGWLQLVSQQLSPGQPIYIALFGGLVMFFCFFYTAIVFQFKGDGRQPEEVGSVHSRHTAWTADS